MLKSMTGFGTGRIITDNYQIDTQIKTVNQRFFDACFYMPKFLFAIEIDLRRLLKKYIARGKTEIRITVKQTNENTANVRVNKALAQSYCKALNELSTLLKLPRTNDVTKIAAFEGVVSVDNLEESDEVYESSCQNDVLAATETALIALVKMRTQEGNALSADFLTRIDFLERTVSDELAALSDTITEAYRSRIEKTVAEMLPKENPADKAYLLQEIAAYADRVDFTEEVVRLKSHLAQFKKTITEAQLAESEPVGRKLDFLLQEINREVNTIASKANNVTAAQICVTLKSEIEKLREQVQNIE